MKGVIIVAWYSNWGFLTCKVMGATRAAGNVYPSELHTLTWGFCKNSYCKCFIFIVFDIIFFFSFLYLMLFYSELYNLSVDFLCFLLSRFYYVLELWVSELSPFTLPNFSSIKSGFLICLRITTIYSNSFLLHSNKYLYCHLYYD